MKTKNITVVLPYTNPQTYLAIAREFSACPSVDKIVAIKKKNQDAGDLENVVVIESDEWTSGQAIQRAIDYCYTDYLLFVTGHRAIELGQFALERMVDVAEDVEAGLVYSDFMILTDGNLAAHPVIDYQIGSIRDDFDFGTLLLFSKLQIQQALIRSGPIADVRWAGLYDLRLRVSAYSRVFHIRERLYTESSSERTKEDHFDYVAREKQAIQKEYEFVATEHLKRIHAYLAPSFELLSLETGVYPVHASVVIPVRNRVATIADAVHSALSQKTNFTFNVIVVDNYSTDGTTDKLKALAYDNNRLVHIIPKRTDLGIGGCWNEAIFSPTCGKFVIQLDSDDLYAHENVLQLIIDKLHEGPYPMVIGSYLTVDFTLREIPPGLVDHQEWTSDNGRNNALRVHGFGAPRAFMTSIIRKIRFPNFSYGEDYFVSLKISRRYEVGRIFESLYLCRRWQDNTDAMLSVEKRNEFNLYKDTIRTEEIYARQQLNRARQTRL
jgi:hypothetical protein